ncbi:MAG: hypothetical protein ACRCZF_07240 [Gemmataceae bacterium]
MVKPIAKALYLAGICVAMVATLSSTAHAQQFVKNGDFSKSTDWTIKVADANFGGIKNGILNLNSDGKADCTASQTLTGVRKGQNYILSAKYRPGARAEEFAKDGDPFFHIKVGTFGTTKYLLPPRATNLLASKTDPKKKEWQWGELYYEFTANEDNPVLLIEGELDDKDGNLDIDDVSVVMVETYKIKAYTIVAEKVKKDHFYIIPGKAGSRATVANDTTPANFIQIKQIDGSCAYKLQTNDPKQAIFLTALAPNQVNFVETKDNTIPEGADFQMVKPLYKEAIGSTSFESVKFNKHYLRHFSFNLCVNNDTPEQARNGKVVYQQDSTWFLEKNPSRSEIETLLKTSGAKTGAVQVSLYWENKNDLDLQVTDPNGETINYDKKTSKSGGVLDVDMNATDSRSTKAAVENIFWAEGKAPKGRYKIVVNHFKNHDIPDPTPFSVRLVVAGKTQLFEGEVVFADSKRKTVTVHEFEVK